MAIGDQWVASCTSAQLLRMFSSTGVQKAPLSLPGPVVCMAGRGTHVAVIYHGAAPLPIPGTVMFAVRVGMLSCFNQTSMFKHILSTHVRCAAGMCIVHPCALSMFMMQGTRI